MGRQIQLYLTPGDLAHFEESLRARLELVCLSGRSDGPHPSFLPSFEIQEMGKTWLTLFLCRPEDVGTLRFREVPAQGYWTIDALSEPIVELSRPYSDGVLMRRGRLYYQKGDFIADGSWHAKPEGFVQWADTLFRVARTTLQRDASLDGYLGSEARAMHLRKEVRFANVRVQPMGGPSTERMRLGLGEQELRSILALPGQKRYEHFIKQVADTQKVWSLRDESGWVCSTTDEGTSVLPLWPHPDYASLAATGGWVGALPHAIDLRKLMGEMLPDFRERGVGVLILPTLDGKGIVPPLEQLLLDLRAELGKY